MNYDLTTDELSHPIETTLPGFKEITLTAKVKDLVDMSESSGLFTLQRVAGESIGILDVDGKGVYYSSLYAMLRENYYKLNDHNPFLDFCHDNGIKYTDAMCVGVKPSVNVRYGLYDLQLQLEDPEFLLIVIDWGLMPVVEVRFDVDNQDTVFARTNNKKTMVLLTKNVEEVFDRIHVVKK